MRHMHHRFLSVQFFSPSCHVTRAICDSATKRRCPLTTAAVSPTHDMTMCANADPPPAAADALATEVYALAYRLLQNPTLERFLHHTFRCACSHGKALRTEEMPVAGFRQFCIDIGLCSLAGPADSRAIPLEQLMQSWPQWSSALPASEQDAAALRQGQELREVIAFGLDQSKHRFIQPAARQDSEVEGLALAVRDAWPGLQFGAPAPDAARADARDAARAPPLVMGHESVQRLFDAAAHRGDHLRRTGFAVALVQLSQYLHPRLCVVRPAQAFGAFLAGYLVPYVRRQGAHALPGAVKALPDAHLRRLVQTHAAAFDVLFDHYTRPTGDGNPHAWVDPRGGRHLTMRGWERFGQDFGCVAAVADAKDAFRLVEGVMYPEQEAVLDKAAFLLLTVHVATREYPHDVHCDRLPTLAAKYQHLTEKMAPLCQSLVEMARDDEPGAAGLPSVASVDPPSGPDMEEHVVELQGKWTGVGSGHGLYVRFGDVVAYTQEVAGAKARVLAPPQSAVGVAVTVFQQAEGWQSRVTRVRSVPLAVSTDGVHYSKPGAAVYTYEQPPHQYPLLDYSAQLFQIFNRYTTLGNPANHQFLYLKEWRQFRKDFGVRTPKAIAAVACADTTVPAEDQLFYHFMTKPKRPPKGGKGPPGVALTFPGFLACAVAIAVDLVDDFETGMQVLLGVDQMHVVSSGQVPCPLPCPALPCPLPSALPSALCPLPSALCPLPYALCPLPSALCPIPSALCPLPSTLCPLPSALYPLPSALYPLPSALCPLPSALCPLPCPLPSALCPLPSALCPLPSALCPLPSALCPLPSALPSALCPLPSALCPLPSALCPLPSALYPLPSALCPLPSALCPLPCPLPSALCPLPSALCPLPSALCPLPSALCPLPSALCPLPSALCPLPPALCPLPSALCPLPSTLYPLPSALCPLPSALCPLPSALCPLPSALYPLPSTLCPLPSALCPLPSALYPLPSALCPLPSALCPLPSILCPLPSALCPLPSALCPLPSALCPLPSALCPLPSALYPLPSALYPLPSTLCPLPSALYPLPSALYPLPSALCPLPSALCPLPSALCPLPYALCPLPSALCPLPSTLCPMPYALCPLPSALYPLPSAL